MISKEQEKVMLRKEIYRLELELENHFDDRRKASRLRKRIDAKQARYAKIGGYRGS